MPSETSTSGEHATTAAPPSMITSTTPAPSSEGQARAKDHENQVRFSHTLLVGAREKARVKWGYDHIKTRKVMLDECRCRSQGSITPHTWQLDVAEALFLGLDCELVAGTGSGKTLPMALQHFLNTTSSGKITLIISPLNVLEEDQVRPFLVLLPSLELNVLLGSKIPSIGRIDCCSQWRDLQRRYSKGE